MVIALKLYTYIVYVLRFYRDKISDVNSDHASIKIHKNMIETQPKLKLHLHRILKSVFNSV